MVSGLGIAVGVRGKRGFPTTKIQHQKNKRAPSKRTRFIRDLVEEIAGLAPYESRAIDMSEVSEKKAQRFMKKRLGKLKTAKKKLRKLEEVKRKIKKRENEIKAEIEAKKKKDETQ